MNRRTFIQKAIAGAGILAAPSLLAPEKRFWQLDQTMITPKFATNDWMVPFTITTQEEHKARGVTVLTFKRHDPLNHPNGDDYHAYVELETGFLNSMDDPEHIIESHKRILEQAYAYAMERQFKNTPGSLIT